MSVSFALIFVDDGQVLGDRRVQLLIRHARKIAWRPSLDLLYRLAVATIEQAVGGGYARARFCPLLQISANVFSASSVNSRAACRNSRFDFGLPGGGLGPRHGAQSAGLRNLNAHGTRPPGNYIPNQMPDMTEALSNGRLKVLFLLGTNMLSSFADAGHVADGLDKADLVVCVDLFMNETARRFADVVLPGTAWLEELGFKVTNTHLYLMERAVEREGETRAIHEILRSLANSLGLANFFPWGSVEEVLDAILDHPTTGHATLASLRAAGGFLPLKVSHVAYADRNFDSPSGKIEFYSSQADKLGLPPLPMH
jgi:anaerobic selenocysteine-containing dehydrogenase